jgi:hypothetical protein
MDISNSAPRHYKIICLGCNSDVPGTGYELRCGCGNALLRTVYQDYRLEVTAEVCGGSLRGCQRSIN